MDFPAHLLNGECPKCHSAYKIVPPDDKNTWSGLWNYRCTWCNKLVFDDRPGRVQPFPIQPRKEALNRPTDKMPGHHTM